MHDLDVGWHRTMKSSECLEWLKGSKIVPVIRADSLDTALKLAGLLFEGGIDVFEITMTVPGAPDAISLLRKEFGAQACVGAGTVLGATAALECLKAGARFVVAPNTDAEVISLCAEWEILCAPGALTPTEVIAASALGAPLIKIFPCDSMGGPSYIKALKAPLPHVELMPTGGVQLDDVQPYLRAGAACVGVGSSLVDLRLLDEDPGRLVDLARTFVEAAKDFAV